MNAGQFFDVFTSKELFQISKLLEKVPQQEAAGNYHSGFRKSSPFFPIAKSLVFDKLEKTFNKKINFYEGIALNELRPLGVHTDHLFKGDTLTDIGIVIPLTNESEITHTVVFNEYSNTINSLTEYVNDPNNKKLDNNAKYLYNNLCSHIKPAEMLEYLSVKGIYRWVPGSVIYFDRKLFHCSDNFFDNGLTRKRAFVIFTTLDDI